MKKVFFILIFSFLGNLYAQKWEIPPVVFNDEINTFCTEINMSLGLTDTNTLVVLTHIGNGYSGINMTHYVLYNPNRGVTIYNASKSSEKIDVAELNEIKLKKKKSREFQFLLDSFYLNNTLSINQDSLQVTTKLGEDGFIHSVNVSDGSQYVFHIWKSGRSSSFGAYAPRTYINGNYPGKIDRLKILALIEGYQKLIKDVIIE